MNKPKISVIIHTASKDNLLFNEHNIESMFEMYLDCLKRQTFKDFEFILVDLHYDNNKNLFNKIYLEKECSFVVKHVPIHENHKYWSDQKLVHISSIKNTGLLYADGELGISFDDAELFPDNLLEMYWGYYNKGFFMHALNKRLKNINIKDKKVDFPIQGEEYINDPRYSQLGTRAYMGHNRGDLLYAGTSFPLLAAIEINGYNEKLDGCKSLEDVEFGIRLAKYGCKLVMDKLGFVYILDHTAKYSEEINSIVVKENYGFIECIRMTGELIKNNKKLPAFELDIINKATEKYQHRPIDFNNKNTKIWLDTPNFDLKNERKKLRASSLWRWQ